MTTASHDTELLKKAVQVAIYYQNRCCELEEIIEMFCRDAANRQSIKDAMELFSSGGAA